MPLRTRWGGSARPLRMRRFGRTWAVGQIGGVAPDFTQLTDNASFESAGAEVDGRHATVPMVQASFCHTVDFERAPYVRAGSYAKKLRGRPAIEPEARGRVMACYRHACICFTNDGAMTNQSPRSTAVCGVPY